MELYLFLLAYAAGVIFIYRGVVYVIVRRRAANNYVQSSLISGQAYQVLGCFMDEKFRPTDDEMERALDYFHDGQYSEHFLPWPRAEK